MMAFRRERFIFVCISTIPHLTNQFHLIVASCVCTRLLLHIYTTVSWLKLTTRTLKNSTQINSTQLNSIQPCIPYSLLQMRNANTESDFQSPLSPEPFSSSRHFDSLNTTGSDSQSSSRTNLLQYLLSTHIQLCIHSKSSNWKCPLQINAQRDFVDGFGNYLKYPIKHKIMHFPLTMNSGKVYGEAGRFGLILFTNHSSRKHQNQTVEIQS